MKLLGGDWWAIEMVNASQIDICAYNESLKIDWDPVKAAANLQAHGVSFGEASTVLEDDFALTREDPDAQGEQRFVTLGMSATGALLVLVYTHRVSLMGTD